MTLIFKRDVAAGAHALVIGCGSYPDSGSTHHTPPMPALVSAPRSAREFTKWLLAHRNDLDAPLASLELLLAEPDGLNHSRNVSSFDTEPFGLAAGEDPRGGVLDIDQPRFTDIAIAIKAWEGRVNASTQAEDGISLFYAVGHGFQTAAQIFLPYDFGEVGATTWNEVLGIGALSVNSSSLKARRQFFMGDCCRTELPPGYAAPQIIGNPVLGPDFSGLQRRRALLEAFSAPPYNAAEGDRDGVSNFMGRLLEALNGAWCDEPDAQARHWVSGRSIHEYLTAHAIADVKHPGEAANLLLSPNVGDAELRVNSDPGLAILSSSQCVVRRRAPPKQLDARPPGSLVETWTTSVPVRDVYEVEIGFAPGAGYVSTVATAFPTRPKPYPVLLKVAP